MVVFKITMILISFRQSFVIPTEVEESGVMFPPDYSTSVGITRNRRNNKKDSLVNAITKQLAKRTILVRSPSARLALAQLYELEKIAVVTAVRQFW
jgi:hypothetical protein